MAAIRQQRRRIKKRKPGNEKRRRRRQLQGCQVVKIIGGKISDFLITNWVFLTGKFKRKFFLVLIPDDRDLKVK